MSPYRRPLADRCWGGHCWWLEAVLPRAALKAFADLCLCFHFKSLKTSMSCFISDLNIQISHLTDSGVNKGQEMVNSPGFGARQITVDLGSISYWLHALA